MSREDKLPVSVELAVPEHALLIKKSFSVANSGDVNEALLMRKLHWRVLPVCLSILVFANIDKANLGFIANELCSDLDLTYTEYGTGASVFFLGLLVSRIPSDMGLRYFGAPVWLMTILFLWGVSCAALSLIQNVSQFYALRLLLGIAEGGAFPGVWYYITQFYPEEYVSIPYAVTALAWPLASAVSGPLTVAFLNADGLFGVRAWRHLLFFEGLFPVLCVPVFYFCFMPSSIEAVQSLSQQERLWLSRRLKHNAVENSAAASEHCGHALWHVAQKKAFWVLSLSSVLRVAMQSVVVYWTTLMIGVIFNPNKNNDGEKTCAYSDATASTAIVMTAVIYVLSSISTLVIGNLAGRVKNRSRVAAWLTAVCGLALALWPVAAVIHPSIRLLALTIVVCLVYGPVGSILGVLVGHYDSTDKSTALAAFTAIDSLGAMLGSITTGAVVDHYGNYNVASVVIGGYGIVGGLTLLLVKDPLSEIPA